MDGLDKKKLGRNIRQARCRLGLTQEQMAERIDMAPEVYGRMERGLLVPRLERFVAICRVLGEAPGRLIFPQDGAEAEGEAPESQGWEKDTMSPLRTALATNVREARKELGLTQVEMAARVRLSVDMYGRIERGTVLPDLEAFVAICRVLGEMSDRLLGLKPPRRKKRR
jgi:DNA-binding XRE family transcriptional regulator